MNTEITCYESHPVFSLVFLLYTKHKAIQFIEVLLCIALSIIVGSAVLVCPVFGTVLSVFLDNWQTGDVHCG